MPRWSRVVLAVVVLAAVGAFVYLLRASSMFEEDHGPKGSATKLVVHVRYQQGQPASAQDTRLLWSVCAVNIPGERATTSVRDGTLTAYLVPALGEDVQRRFVGCLQDLTLPAMLGQVISSRTVPSSTVPSSTVPSSTVPSSTVPSSTVRHRTSALAPST